MAENVGRETAASRARAGSLHLLTSGIRIPPSPSHLCLEAEDQEATVLESDSEVASEEEVKVEDRRRFFKPCIWTNYPFTCIRVLVEGAVAVVVGDIQGGRWMRSWRCGGLQRGRQRQDTLSLSYRPRSSVGGRCGHMLSHARPNRGNGILCC